nr:MAG TPA: hypothetical protein [Caudoviricetes sp.]
MQGMDRLMICQKGMTLCVLPYLLWGRRQHSVCLN